MSTPITNTETVDSVFSNIGDFIDSFPARIHVNTRGKLIVIHRTELNFLPECLLALILPNGLQPLFENKGATRETALPCTRIDPSVLSWLLNSFQKLTRDTYLQSNWISQSFPGTSASILLIEYCDIFVVPQDLKPVTLELKKEVLNNVLRQNKVFQDLLERKSDSNSSFPEYALMDLLCCSGFSAKDKWMKRIKEPGRTSICSYNLVCMRCSDLKTDQDDSISYKLLLFWRKPSSKCWWIPSTQKLNGRTVRVWKRKTWVLEVNVFGNDSPLQSL
ncbi:phosphatase activator [Schizosaccharomyces japonicus yFS275]|uniref:Phosphatase activator n=1 Tax=Schizosaccharomyces japonicus (strain yFS275 / FY16936) TaxID=402676 RepID=B6K0W9_SCHJY|nr:phosphatase activator [Schizosaccharomyces japonicus yFS275]EEB07590.1 phosphatase activator [Schizosaccharomyces japonicus yFS275]